MTPCIFSICDQRFDFHQADEEKKGHLTYANRFRRGFRYLINPNAGDVKFALCEFVWSPSVFYQGIRREENFTSASTVGLDFDGNLTVEDAKDIFRNYRHMIGTTRSHTPEKPRLRVLLRLDDVVVEVQEYKRILKYYINKFNSDTACSDGARFYYPCRKIIHTGGHRLLSTSIPRVSREIKQRKTHGFEKMPAYIIDFLENGHVFGSGRNESCFKTSCILSKRGYSFDDILHAINDSPFNRDKFSEGELNRATLQGVKYGLQLRSM